MQAGRTYFIRKDGAARKIDVHIAENYTIFSTMIKESEELSDDGVVPHQMGYRYTRAQEQPKIIESKVAKDRTALSDTRVCLDRLKLLQKRMTSYSVGFSQSSRRSTRAARDSQGSE